MWNPKDGGSFCVRIRRCDKRSWSDLSSQCCGHSFAFGSLHTSKQTEAAVSVVHDDVLPFYQKHGVSVKAILTDSGREFHTYPYELYLPDIERRRVRIRSPRTNGFVERFHKTTLDEFLQIVFRQKLYTALTELQEDFDRWLYHYNHEHPHLGYRNMGRKPYETITSFLKQNGNVGEEG